MLRSIALVLLAVNAAAQPVPAGSIVTLKNVATGKFLSAFPTQQVQLSTSPSGWEQWEYTPYPSTAELRSYHGTLLMRWYVTCCPVGPAVFFHAPQGNGQPEQRPRSRRTDVRSSSAATAGAWPT